MNPVQANTTPHGLVRTVRDNSDISQKKINMKHLQRTNKKTKQEAIPKPNQTIIPTAEGRKQINPNTNKSPTQNNQKQLINTNTQHKHH